MRKLNSNNTSGFPGVSYHAHTSKWEARIRVGDRCRYLGLFLTAEQAHRAFQEAAEERAATPRRKRAPVACGA